MKVNAKEREFSIFDLFVHDGEATEVTPFCQYALMQKMNDMAAGLYPDRYVQFISPDYSGLSQWNVRFNKTVSDWDSSGNPKFETFPMRRSYGERDFRRMIPAELDEVLLELNKAVIEL